MVKYRATVIGFPRGGVFKLWNKNTVPQYKQSDMSDELDGSPMLCHEYNKNDEQSKFYEMVGIHTEGQVEDEKSRGTLLNVEKLKWIADTLKDDSFATSNYQWNALLISSNPK